MRGAILTRKRARAFRRALNLPELILWKELQKRQLRNLRFRRQHPIGSYVLDFFCPSARLAVEVDGAGHHEQEQHRKDVVRDRWLADRHIRVLRVSAGDLLNPEPVEGVVVAVAQAAAPSTASRSPSPAAAGED